MSSLGRSPTLGVTHKLLIIEDDVAHLSSLYKIFEKMGLEVTAASRAEEGLMMLDERGPFSVVLSDLMLPDLDGMELLVALKERQPDLEVVMMTAFGTIERAVEAMRLGAYDFVTKPLRRAEIEKAVRRALERAALIAENRSLKAQLAQVNAAKGLEQLIGHSAPFRNALSAARQAASAHAPVMITGETGVGKRSLARAIHQSSTRSEGPLIELSCASLPSELIEVELFGDEERPGALRRSWGGSLLLSELHSLSPRLQIRLSRALTAQSSALGRLICTTDEDLSAALEEGDFERELYHQLSVIPIALTPLRGRLDDVLLLSEQLLRRLAARDGRRELSLTPEAKQRLMAHSWPGNITELESVIERAMILGEGEVIRAQDLPISVDERAQRLQYEGDDLFYAPLGTPLHEIERRLIHRTLAYVGNDKRRAAQLLGITSRTIYRKLAEEPSES